MCKRCVFLEGREELINNAGDTFDNDVTGTEHLNIVSIIVDIENNTLKYVCFDNRALVDDVDQDTAIPHFVFEMELPDKGNFVSPLSVRQAIDRGSIVSAEDMNNPMKAFEYIHSHDEQGRYIVAMNGGNNPLAMLRVLLESILED